MNDFYKSLPISAQFSVVRFTVNSQQSTVNSQQSTVNSQHHFGATGIYMTNDF
ncbi:hypothetical protein MicvaDRAFT_3788 [Microcoleus vaginatus FGP-2]|nr:hypothetical protein MicvaDRAFT_3788 [Microcoleus vaginatus FGP-2]